MLILSVGPPPPAPPPEGGGESDPKLKGWVERPSIQFRGPRNYCGGEPTPIAAEGNVHPFIFIELQAASDGRR